MKPQMDQRHTTSFYEFGPFRLDPVKRLLLRGSVSVPLTQKAFDTLLVLVQSSERVVHKDELMRLVWPDTIVEENNLTQSISLLRKALGESRKDHKYIVTIQGRGYRFVADVEESFDEDFTNGTKAPPHGCVGLGFGTIASTLISRLTSLPTKSPPSCITRLQVIPKSLRSTFRLLSTRRRLTPEGNGSLIGPLRVKGITTSFVTPRTVRSPTAT